MTVLPNLEQLLGDAADRLAREPIPDVGDSARQTRSARRRSWRALALFAVLVLGGATVALAAAGVFESGKPIGPEPGYAPRPSVGTGAPRGGVRLVALQVPDPAGGTPWGLGVVRTTEGLACPVSGRVVNGRLGALGIDYAFADDGRFHPLLASAAIGPGCAPPDAHGRLFLAGPGWLQSASGDTAPSTAIAQRPACRMPGDLSQGVRCPRTALRSIFYGFLGPDARTIAYTYRGVRHVEHVAGPDGGYLVVLPAPPGVAGRAAKYGDIAPPATADVTYASGRTCDLQSANPAAAGPGPCGAVGYVEGPLDLPSHKQITTRVLARYESTLAVGLLPPGPTIVVTFTSRIAITNSRYSYTVRLAPPHTRACRRTLAAAGGGTTLNDSTTATIKAGHTVRLLVALQPPCTGRYTGRVYLHRAPRWPPVFPGINRLGANHAANIAVTTVAIDVP
jgi:hypothetical protein